MHKLFHTSVFTVFKIICSQCIKHGSSSESVVWVFQILPQYNFSGKDKCGRWDKKENKISPWLQWPENDCPIIHVTLLWNLGGCHPGNFMTVCCCRNCEFSAEGTVFIAGLPQNSAVEESTCDAGDTGSILGSGKSPGEENGNPLWLSCP